MRSYTILIFGCLIFSLSCKNEGISSSEYIKWVENEGNGLNVSKRYGNYNIMAQYKPIPYQALRQSKIAKPSKNKFKNQLKELEGLDYFNLVISLNTNTGDVLKEQIESEQDYYNRIKYFSFDIQKDLSLTDGSGKTKPCVFSHFERNYGLASSITILMAFEADNQETDKTILYKDKVLGLGTVKLLISKSAIEQIPELALD